ncbi:MAG: YihY/virulence factor BrkB family protein [Gaiellaceae bacterium]
MIDRFGEHELLTYASAIARQVLVSLLGLALRGFSLLAVTGERRIWEGTFGPKVSGRLPVETFVGVNYAVERILDASGPGLVVFGAVLTIWEVSGGVRAVAGALNRIYDEEEDRSFAYRWLFSFAVAIGLIVLVLGAIAAVTTAKGMWLVLAWPGAVVLLGAAIALLLRFLPHEPRPLRWVSLGTALTIGGWIVLALLFRLYLSAVSFRTPWGTLTALLLLTGTVYWATIVFLTGVELDELARDEQARGGARPARARRRPRSKRRRGSRAPER